MSNVTTNNVTVVDSTQKNYLISARGKDFNGMRVNDIKIRTNNPDQYVNAFLKANKSKGMTVYLNEMKITYKVGKLIFTNLELAETNADMYGLQIEKQVLINTIKIYKDFRAGKEQ